MDTLDFFLLALGMYLAVHFLVRLMKRRQQHLFTELSRQLALEEQAATRSEETSSRG